MNWMISMNNIDEQLTGGDLHAAHLSVQGISAIDNMKSGFAKFRFLTASCLQNYRLCIDFLVL